MKKCLPSLFSLRQAYNFMRGYFALMGCKEPNAPEGELHIQGADKLEIYREYVDSSAGDCPVLDYSSFVKLWSQSFSHVRLHEFKVVSLRVLVHFYIFLNIITLFYHYRFQGNAMYAHSLPLHAATALMRWAGSFWKTCECCIERCTWGRRMHTTRARKRLQAGAVIV